MLLGRASESELKQLTTCIFEDGLKHCKQLALKGKGVAPCNDASGANLVKMLRQCKVSHVVSCAEQGKYAITPCSHCGNTLTDLPLTDNRACAES